MRDVNGSCGLADSSGHSIYSLSADCNVQACKIKRSKTVIIIVIILQKILLKYIYIFVVIYSLLSKQNFERKFLNISQWVATKVFYTF